MKTKEKEMRIFIGYKPWKGNGARNYCEIALKRLTEAFSQDSLARYGLVRDGETFDDLMRGGEAAKRKYRTALEKQLPVNSEIPFIAERAKESVSEAIQELDSFMLGVSRAGRLPENCIMSMRPDYCCFDEEQGRVVFTAAGTEALEDVEGYYITNEKQKMVYDMAQEIVERVCALNTLLEGTKCKAINSSGRDILRLANGGIEIVNENIVNV